MRLCHSCRNWNSDWPTRCRHCGVGLDGRLCPRNHVNPVDSLLSFCGECGQPLERTGKIVQGAGRVITDGPFAEAKDVVGGFTLIQAEDVAHAAELAKGCPILDAGGYVEVRPIMKLDI